MNFTNFRSRRSYPRRWVSFRELLWDTTTSINTTRGLLTLTSSLARNTDLLLIYTSDDNDDMYTSDNDNDDDDMIVIMIVNDHLQSDDGGGGRCHVSSVRGQHLCWWDNQLWDLHSLVPLHMCWCQSSGCLCSIRGEQSQEDLSPSIFV